DTWRDGIHSYLTYLRDRLTVARDLLTDSGSIFVQIGDENLHRVRSLLDEVFGAEMSVALIPFATTCGLASTALDDVYNFVCWYAKDRNSLKYRPLFEERPLREGGGWAHRQVILADGRRVRLGVDGVRELLETDDSARPYTLGSLQSQGSTEAGSFQV